MPYKVSRARQDFIARTQRLAASAKTANKIISRTTITRVPTSTSEALQVALQGAVIQIHSAVENYVTAVVEDWLGQLHARNRTMASLPTPLRTWLIHEAHEDAYRFFEFSGDESRLLQAIEVTRPPYKYVDDIAYIPTNLSTSMILKRRTYPSFDNLKGIFQRLGFPPLRAYLSEKFKFNAELYFASFSDPRTSIAHSITTSLALSDVLRYRDRAQTIVCWLDHAFFSALTKNSGQSCWR